MRNRVFLTALVLLVAQAQIAFGADDEVAYLVELKPVQGESSSSLGSLTLANFDDEAGELSCYWYFEQTGGLGLPFPLRFGRWNYDQGTGIVEEPPARIEVELDDRVYRVDVPIPMIRLPEGAEVGAEWTVGNATWTIEGSEPRAELPCWRIEVIDAIGPQATIWVVEEGHRVVALRQRVFIGQGVPYELVYEVEATRELDATHAQRIDDTLAIMYEAFAMFELDATQPRWELEDPTRESLASLLEELGDPPGSQMLTLALDDAKLAVDERGRRARSLQQLRERIVGQPLPDFDLADLEDERHTNAEYHDRVLVLHFWKYRDLNLSPPYGQVGYLDFIARRLDREKVAVIGVAEISPEGDERRPPQIQSAKRFHEFMNLSYPVVLDDGRFLKSIGDPQEMREPLPLWMIIDAQGQVVTYQTGLFAINPQEGIKQLSEEIDRVLADQ